MGTHPIFESDFDCLTDMDRTDKTSKQSPSYIVKYQHKTLRKKFLKTNNSKLIWKQALENISNLKEYSNAMDILSRNWTHDSDGSNRLDWARNWIVKYFEVKRSKLIRRNPDILFDDLDLFTNSSGSTTDKPLINILDFGIRTISIDIAPANESVYLCDFSSVKIGLPKESDIIEIEKDSNFCQKISKFKTSSFDQICFLYVLSYMPDPRLRLASL